MANVLPYQEITEDDYASCAAVAFTASRPVPGTLVLTGPCPRCTVIIHVPIVDGVYKSSRRRRTTTAAQPEPSATQRVEPVVCTCDEPHADRPANRVGCGAYWLLRITVSES
jgi:hypothetical protein